MPKEDFLNILEVSDLAISFGGIKALDNISFQVKHNSITAIIGPNGAGKTTLFNCVTGFYRPSFGKLILNTPKSQDLLKKLGQKVKLSQFFNPKELMSVLYYKMFGGTHLIAQNGIARTFQNIRLFKEMSVIENLLVAQHINIDKNLIGGLLNTKAYQQSENNAVATAYFWLDYFGLSDFANRLAGELAYGQQRYLEIARAMCIKPKILCLDEPAAGLNHSETKNLSEKLVALQQEYNLTIILIEHDMSMVMNISDKIIVLDHGEILAQGTPDAIKTNKKVISAYLGTDEDDNSNAA